MQSIFNKRQREKLIAEGWGISRDKRHATTNKWVGSDQWRLHVFRRRSGWAWSCQHVRTYKMYGGQEGMQSPEAAFAHAEIENWGRG